ncbi:cathepsin L-like proteinase [Rhinophrynus dorsalis]
MHLDKYLLVFSTIVICGSASLFLDQEWNAWKSKYGKKYVTPNRELFRRKAWEASWEKVQKHNQLADQGLTSYRMAVNQFADLTTEEWNSKSCIRSSEKSKPLSSIPTFNYRNNNDIPPNVDWRKSNCVTPVKNQGTLCGSCWAFSTVGVIESRYCIKKHKLINFSEQQLVDCDDTSEGCCGGFPIDALAYVAENGIMRRKDYKYTESKLECKYNLKKATKLNVTKYYTLPGEKNMASSVALEGPIIVSIGVSEDFQKYSEGIFDGDCAEEVNHAVIIVGYGTQPAIDENGEDIDYWIIKNSWGKEWGDNGYVKMRRNIKQCGIEEEAAAVDIV